MKHRFKLGDIITDKVTIAKIVEITDTNKPYELRFYEIEVIKNTKGPHKPGDRHKMLCEHIDYDDSIKIYYDLPKILKKL